ncbi:transmembrane protein EpsG [Paenibacillus forsythiae]|uniref:Transmembrane protein EpsG n=1 Tax=Paenibacillus forsythiae TaxID=365616 RepID=A0ABU3HDC7_9BACL|nr:EpsG family protein [Paenibacillus forsythiae]MDT3428808.1 transmembrane protein EpsG [Paenibacillus forsythiae]
MTVLWIHLAFAFMLSLSARYFSTPSLSLPAGVRPNRLLVLMTALWFCLISGIRNNIGDTEMYVHSFLTDNFTWQYVWTNDDIGFNIFQKILKLYTNDPQYMILITALVTNMLIMTMLYKYARLFELAVYIYITSGAFIVSMNGIRQYLATSMVFAATKYLFEGNWKRYIPVVLFASLFHQSALILIPIFFIVRRKAWTTSTLLLLGVAVLIVFGYSQFSEMLFSAIKDTQYGVYQSLSEGGANVVRVAFYGLPLIVAYLGREKLSAQFKDIDVIVNMSLIGFVLMLVATQNWIFARLAIYFTVYQILLTAWIVKAFRRKDQKLVYLVVLVVYLVYFFYENVITLGIDYRSDLIPWFN